jgi:diguanylate cyclase (GGDEF)-like protein
MATAAPRAAALDAGAALAKLNRELRLLIACNQQVVRAKSETQLLGELCRMLIDSGGYALAWVGLIRPGADRRVRVVAHAGRESSYLERLEVSWDDRDTGRGPTGRAIREHCVQVCRYTETDPTFAPWRAEARRHGYQSSIALPLLLDGSCFGALSLYSGRPDGFDESEVRLLEELAIDLTFGMKALRALAAERRQQRQIERLAQILKLQSAVHTAVARIRDRGALLEEACRLATELGGFDGAVAWRVEPDGRSARLHSSSGAATVNTLETVARLEIGDGTAHDKSLSGKALRTGELTVCADIASTEQPLAVRERLLEVGVRAIAALPLIVEGKRFAVLTLTSRDSTAVQDAELLQLLQDMMGSLSLALRSLEHADAAEYLTHFDPLTGLAKRALFCERVDGRLLYALGPRSQLMVIAFDVRGLGSLNASFGNRVGDLALREIAERLKQHARGEERVGYLGAGAFVVIEPPAGHGSQSVQRALALSVFGDPLEIEGHKIRLAASYGVAQYPEDAITGGTLVQRAEAALKRAKDSGEQYLHYRLEMSSETAERLELESKLRTPLEERQFILHYQPQINLATGKIESVEGLIRWNDPTAGISAPSRFLPSLESTGLIVPVGGWVLAQAVEDCERWHRSGLGPIRVAVNVSGLQLKQREFVSMVLRFAERLAVLPGFGLDLEITETMLLADLEVASEKLRELRKAGIRVALDDFGTGYSSLGLLSKLPVDLLKIDRTFVSGLPQDAASATLVSSIIQLGAAFRLITVAEGVETAAQLEALREMRCTHSQGFLHGPPLPAEELEHTLARRHRPRRP